MHVSGTGTDERRAAELRRLGLVTGHAYSLIELYSTPRLGKRLVRLRNPWAEGRGERDGKDSSIWSGPWRDGGPEWDSEPGLHEACNPGLQETDGVFWMALDDFVRYFERVDTAKLYETPRAVVRIKVPLPCWTHHTGAKLFAVRIEVPKTTSVEIVLNQQPQGAFRRRDADGHFCYSRDRDAFTRDLGIAVVSEGLQGLGSELQTPLAATGLRYVLGCARRVDPWVSCEGVLDGHDTSASSIYWVVPVTLNRYCDATVNTGRGRPDDADEDFVVLEVSSAHRIAAQVVQVSRV